MQGKKNKKNLELIDLPNVGLKTAQTLLNSGIVTIEDLAFSTVDVLVKIPGIGLKRAEILLQSAKKAFDDSKIKKKKEKPEFSSKKKIKQLPAFDLWDSLDDQKKVNKNPIPSDSTANFQESSRFVDRVEDEYTKNVISNFLDESENILNPSPKRDHLLASKKQDIENSSPLIINHDLNERNLENNISTSDMNNINTKNKLKINKRNQKSIDKITESPDTPAPLEGNLRQNSRNVRIKSFLEKKFIPVKFPFKIKSLSKSIIDFSEQDSTLVNKQNELSINVSNENFKKYLEKFKTVLPLKGYKLIKADLMVDVDSGGRIQLLYGKEIPYETMTIILLMVINLEYSDNPRNQLIVTKNSTNIAERKADLENVVNRTDDFKEILIYQEQLHDRLQNKDKIFLASLFNALGLKVTQDNINMTLKTGEKEVNFYICSAFFTNYEINHGDAELLFPFNFAYNTYLIRVSQNAMMEDKKGNFQYLLTYLEKKAMVQKKLAMNTFRIKRKKYVSFTSKFSDFALILSIPILVLGVMLWMLQIFSIISEFAFIRIGSFVLLIYSLPILIGIINIFHLRKKVRNNQRTPSFKKKDILSKESIPAIRKLFENGLFEQYLAEGTVENGDSILSSLQKSKIDYYMEDANHYQLEIQDNIFFEKL